MRAICQLYHDDNKLLFVNQHSKGFFSGISLKQLSTSTCKHVALLRHIITTPIRPVNAPTP